MRVLYYMLDMLGYDRMKRVLYYMLDMLGYDRMRRESIQQTCIRGETRSRVGETETAPRPGTAQELAG